MMFDTFDYFQGDIKVSRVIGRKNCGVGLFTST